MFYLIGADNPFPFFYILDIFVGLIPFVYLQAFVFFLMISLPFLVTPLFVYGAYYFLYRKRFWSTCKWPFVSVVVISFGVDTALSVNRHIHTQRIPTERTVHASVQPPEQLILVNLRCEIECRELLHSGAVNEVFLVRTLNAPDDEFRQLWRIRPGVVEAGQCSPMRKQFAISSDEHMDGMETCPEVEVEGVAPPTNGLFIIRETFSAPVNQSARRFHPRYLEHGPPGRAIRFTGVEAQLRKDGDVQVLAQATHYQGPGFIIPVLVGCWSRPDMGIGTLPRGDARCGFWRLIGKAGGVALPLQTDWIYSNVFELTDD